MHLQNGSRSGTGGGASIPTRSSISGTAARAPATRPARSSAASAVGAPTRAAPRSTTSTAGTIGGTISRPVARHPLPGAVSHDALQAELDALADDHFGHVATVAPPPSATTGATDSPYYKKTADDGVSVELLEKHTQWRRGPRDAEGRTFNASGSNLLCMDVLVPPSGPALCVVGSADHGLKVFDLASMREVKSLFTKSCGHTEWVTACRFLPDRRVVSAGMDAKLCLWGDVTRGRPARCVDLLGHTSSVSQVEVNTSCGRDIAMSASYDRTMRLWDVSGTGRELGRFTGHKAAVTHFSWQTTEVLSGDRGGTVKLWDVETTQCRRTAASTRGQIGSLAHLLHPTCGHLVMFGDQGGALTVLDARAPPKSGVVFQDVVHPGGMVTSIRCPSAAAVAAPLIATCGADKRLVIRDARANFAELYTITDHDDFVYSMETLGDLLLSGAGNGRLLVHDVATGRLCYELDGNTAAVREMFASPSMLVAAGDDGKAKVFDLS